MASKWPKVARIGFRAIKRAQGLAVMNLGRIASASPLSKNWGYDRGTPVDRYYIEKFLTAHADDVRGHVVEVQEDDYSRRFGGTRVTRQDILNVDDSNPRATIIGDLADAKTLKDETFDCIILTQTLHLVFDMPAAVANARRALKPEGVMLVTVPGITPVEPGEGYHWYWSLTEDALRRLLEASFDPAKVETRTYGNLHSATAFLHAAAAQEIGKRRLERFDPRYPVTIAARAVA